MRLANIMIDCSRRLPGVTLEVAREFWSQVLAVPVMDPDEGNEGRYAVLGKTAEVGAEVQLVSSFSGVHLDFEVEGDLEIEVNRLESLGAVVKSRHPQGWVVLWAPTGHEFCVFRKETPVG